MAEYLGDDFGGVHDLDPNLTEVTGRECLLQAVARRWYCLAGSLFYDRDYGQGVETFLHTAVQSASEISASLEEEALKDERVQDVRVSVSFSDETLAIVGRIDDGDGPFSFTVLVSALDVKVLLENAR